MNCFQVVFLVACGLTFVLLAASAGGPAWLKSEGTVLRINVKTEAGIFRICTEALGTTTCDNWKANSGSSEVKATRAFMLLAILATIVAAIVAFISLCTEKVSPTIGSYVLIVAGLCALIGAAIFTDDNRKAVSNVEKLGFGWSFALAWVGMVVAFISAVLGFFAAKK